MSQDEFTKLYRYMTAGFERIDKALAQKADKADMDRVLGLLDEMIKRQEIADHERLVLVHQLDRHDGWIHELAQIYSHKLTT